MPIGITVKKTIALVNCLAKLHNFCIDEVDAAAEGLREDRLAPFIELLEVSSNVSNLLQTFQTIGAFGS
eukprot:CCRYP_001013-RA/>CCRYP_001013-RA protein AED:0.71 eAED:0.71 QI:0/0/0/0.5/1/1/2/0/68